MELNKCTRCGAFHTNSGDVCPKCFEKDALELSTFRSYIEEYGFSSIDTIATETGIAQKNISRFLGYEGIENINGIDTQFSPHSGVIFN